MKLINILTDTIYLHDTIIYLENLPMSMFILL